MKKPLKMEVVGSRVRLAGLVQRMCEEIWTKRAWKTEEDARRRITEPKL